MSRSERLSCLPAAKIDGAGLPHLVFGERRLATNNEGAARKARGEGRDRVHDIFLNQMRCDDGRNASASRLWWVFSR